MSNRRELAARVVTVVGLVWAAFVVGYYLFASASEGMPLVNDWLRWAGMR